MQIKGNLVILWLISVGQSRFSIQPHQWLYLIEFTSGKPF